MSRLPVVRVVVIPALAVLGIAFLAFARHVPLANLGILLLAFVLLVDLTSLARGRLQNVFLVLATLSIGLAGVEGFVEARAPRLAKTEPKGLWAHDAELGSRPATPGTYAVEKSVDGHLAYRASYTIDDKLRRLTRSNPNGPRVRFFGDSFTFGEGLDDKDTLPQQFADLSGADVLNFGYPGYSPAQALRAVEAGLFDKDLARTRLVVLQTANFHVERTACLPDWTAGAPRYVMIAGRLKLQGRCEPMPGQSFALFRLAKPELQKVRRADVETYIAIVNAFTALVRAKYHAEVLVLDMSDGSAFLKEAGFTPEEIESRFRAGGALVIDGEVDAKPDDVLWIPYDGHPAATQYRLLAAKILKYLAANRPDILKVPDQATATVTISK